MQVVVEDKEGLEKHMRVSFDATEMSKEIQSRLQSLSKTAKLNGFRPGKIPFAVIKKKFGKQVDAEVLQDNISKTIQAAVEQEKLKIAASPSITEVDYNTEKNEVNYTASFEIMPKITLASMNDLEVEKPQVSIQDSDIEKTIEDIRKQHQHFHVVDRAAQDNDKITCNFVGTIDGKAFNNNEGKNIAISIGEKKMIPGFEEGLIGTKAGQQVVLNLEFPADYQFDEVAGKAVDFNIDIIKVEEPHLPELNDEFFASFGTVEGGLEAFKGEVKKNMDSELEKAIQRRVKSDVMKKLISINTLELPKSLIAYEARNIADEMKKKYDIQGDNLEQNLSLFNEEASKRVSLSLLMSEIVKINGLKVAAGDITKKIIEISQSYENPQEVVSYYNSNQQRRSEIEALLLEESVVDFVCNQAKVSSKDYSFADFMDPKTS